MASERTIRDGILNDRERRILLAGPPPHRASPSRARSRSSGRERQKKRDAYNEARLTALDIARVALSDLRLLAGRMDYEWLRDVFIEPGRVARSPADSTQAKATGASVPPEPAAMRPAGQAATSSTLGEASADQYQREADFESVLAFLAQRLGMDAFPPAYGGGGETNVERWAGAISGGLGASGGRAFPRRVEVVLEPHGRGVAPWQPHEAPRRGPPRVKQRKPER